MSDRNRHWTIVLRIGPAIIRNDRGPTGTAGVLIVGIAAEALIQLTVFAELVTVECYAQPGLIRYGYRPIRIGHEASFDDVVGEVMVMSVGSEGDIGDDGAKVQHGCQLYSELTGRVDGHTELKRLADAGGFHAGAYAAPERSIEKDDIYGAVKHVGREL